MCTSGTLITVLRIEAMTGVVLEDEEEMGGSPEENDDSRVGVCGKGVPLHDRCDQERARESFGYCSMKNRIQWSDG